MTRISDWWWPERALSWADRWRGLAMVPRPPQARTRVGWGGRAGGGVTPSLLPSRGGDRRGRLCRCSGETLQGADGGVHSPLETSGCALGGTRRGANGSQTFGSDQDLTPPLPAPFCVSLQTHLLLGEFPPPAPGVLFLASSRLRKGGGGGDQELGARVAV